MSAARFIVVLFFACAGCGNADSAVQNATPQPDAGGDPVETESCLGCHTAEKASWQNPSSHRTLFACTSCHALLSDEPGPGHANRGACTDCHSEASHPMPKAECTRCHDQHGSENAFLIRKMLTRFDGMVVEIDLGTTSDGLVHAGTGLCETCHTETAHYLANGLGAPHYTTDCTQCHDHQAGFENP